jgi:hypothetical protein
MEILHIFDVLKPSVLVVLIVHLVQRCVRIWERSVGLGLLVGVRLDICSLKVVGLLIISISFTD